MIEGLEQATGTTFPALESPDMPAFLEGLCKKYDVGQISINSIISISIFISLCIIIPACI